MFAVKTEKDWTQRCCIASVTVQTLTRWAENHMAKISPSPSRDNRNQMPALPTTVPPAPLLFGHMGKHA
jgi:hypothetical protein